MARDGSGGHSLPYGAYTPGTLADADKVTADFADLSAAIAQSLSKDGQTTPTGNLLRITMTKRKVVKDASKNPKARVYEYKGPATLKLTQTTTPVEVDPNAPPPVLIERLDRPTVPTWAP